MHFTAPAIIVEVATGMVDIAETPVALNRAIRGFASGTVLRILDVRGVESRVAICGTEIRVQTSMADKEEIHRLLVGIGSHDSAFDISVLMTPSLSIDAMFRTYFHECTAKGCAALRQIHTP